MKKRKLIIIFVTIVALIILMLVYVNFKGENFNININVTNNTRSDVNLNMSILLHKENTSTSEKTISLTTLKEGATDKKNATVNTPEGDFGLVLKINESENSLYFTSGTKLSYVNYDLEIEEASNGDIVLKGVVKSRKIFSTVGTNEIKPIIIKGE